MEMAVFGSAPALWMGFLLVLVPLLLWAAVLWAPGTSNTSMHPKLLSLENQEISYFKRTWISSFF